MTSRAQAELIAARFGPATLAYGGFLVGAALLSMIAPFAIGSAMTALLGCLFLAAGAIGALAMFADWSRHAVWWRSLWAATAVGTGVALLAVTLMAGTWNAAVIGACFAFQGLSIAAFAYAHRHHAGSRWIPLALSGLLAAACPAGERDRWVACRGASTAEGRLPVHKAVGFGAVGWRAMDGSAARMRRIAATR